MSLFTFITDYRAIARELKRIGDALERAFPPTGDPAPRAAAGADDVSYASDEATAKQELMDTIGQYEKEMADDEEA